MVAAVKFATSHGLQLAARSGGHGAVRARPLLDPCVPAAASAAAAGAWLLPGMVCSPSSRLRHASWAQIVLVNLWLCIEK